MLYLNHLVFIVSLLKVYNNRRINRINNNLINEDDDNYNNYQINNKMIINIII